MKIAILGWGSLIWCPGSLAIRTAWHADGPQLPIEFARISDDERLTLVILPGRQKQPTYWALSSFDKLELAKANLQKREGCKRASDIHCAVASQGSGSDDKIVSEVSAWLKDKPDLDAAAWTGLTSNWEEKKSKQFGAREALDHLDCLKRRKDQNAFRRAIEYVRNGPPQIQTEVRLLLKDRGKAEGEDWSDNELPRILFAERTPRA